MLQYHLNVVDNGRLNTGSDIFKKIAKKIVPLNYDDKDGSYRAIIQIVIYFIGPKYIHYQLVK